MIKISSQINSILQAFNMSKEKSVQTAIKKIGTTDDGRITGKTGDIYSVDVKGTTYKVKSQFDFAINERVLISTPFGSTEKYLYPNKMGSSGGEVVDAYTKAETDTFLDGKVDKIAGKGLSTNDYTTDEKNKLAGIANNATANDTDANLKNRANHTGTQNADTITDGTTNKVLTSTMKAHYDTAYTNNHTHSNKTALDLVSGTNTGDETVISIGGLINGATEKTTPVDADMAVLMDSESSNVLKKLSWSNIKATLKTYFDTLYNNYIHPTQSAITSDNSNGVVIQDISVDNLGHTTSIGTYDLDNRYYTETEIDTKLAEISPEVVPTQTFTLPATVGWFRVAQSPIDADLTSCFIDLRWQGNSHKGHCITSIKAQGTNQSVLTQLLCNSSYSTPYIYYMRIVRPSTANGNRTYLEVYLNYAYETTIEMILNNNVGWEFLSALENGSIPTGYGSYQLTYSNYAPIQTSSNTNCSNLNATYLQGYTYGSFQRQASTTTSLPTPSSGYRNFIYWLNQSGHNDKPYIGIRNADGTTYSFKELATTEYVDNAVASSGGSEDNYDRQTTWNTEETIYTTTWTDGTKNYSSVITELSDTQYRKQLYVDSVLTEQWDITETASSITTDYTKF